MFHDGGHQNSKSALAVAMFGLAGATYWAIAEQIKTKAKRRDNRHALTSNKVAAVAPLVLYNHLACIGCGGGRCRPESCKTLSKLLMNVSCISECGLCVFKLSPPQFICPR